MDIEISKDITLEQKLEITLLDRVKMQRDLMIQMGVGDSQEQKQKWIDMYAKHFKDIELVRPELVIGYSNLKDDDQLLKERLSIMQRELEDLVAKNS